MGQVISSALRCFGQEVNRDRADTSPLIPQSQGLSYCVNIYPSDYEALRQSVHVSPPIMFPSTDSHGEPVDSIGNSHDKPVIDVPLSESCVDLEVDERSNLHSLAAANSSILCLDQETRTIYAEEIKDVEVNKQEPARELGLDMEAAMSKQVSTEERRIGPYTSSQKILFVGEGDFSFSASLAEAFGSAANMLATSLDSQEFLSTNYKYAMRNISQLTDRGCTVLHCVDCTIMSHHFSSMRFDRIIYNFPHAGFRGRDEPRESQLSRHRTLVRLFLANAKKLVKEGGEIHITHKSKGFFRQWNMKELASSEGLMLLQEVPFNLKDYPGYRTMYGFGGNNSFNCFPSKTYKFGIAP